MRFSFFALIGLCWLLILSTSCDPAKRAARKQSKAQQLPAESAVEVEPSPIPIDLLSRLRFEPDWFSSSTKIDFKDQGSSTQFKANIRMRRDSAIWISVTPGFVKVEVGRALITRDSIKVLDRLNKQVYLAGIDYMQQFTKYPFDFDDLQNLLLGNTSLEITQAESAQNESEYLFTSNSGTLEESASYSKQPLCLSKFSMVDKTAGRSADCSFYEYRDTDSGKFSTKRHLFLDAGYIYEVKLAFEKLELNEALSLPFSHSSKYEIIRP